jgi:hypothetical protein
MTIGRPRMEVEELLLTLAAYEAADRNQTRAAASLDISRQALQDRLKQAALRGMMGAEPVLPGFVIAETNTTHHASGAIRSTSIRQVPEPGPKFEALPGFDLKQRSTLASGSGDIKLQWSIERPEARAQQLAMRAVVEGFIDEIPRAEPVPFLMLDRREDLLNQYTITDAHFGKLSWGEECGSDYDLKIAEQMWLDWFSMSLRLSPDAATGILAQLGDMLHYDSQLSVTPTHGHVLDSDSRLQKMIRVVIRVLRRMVRMMLGKYDHVHLIMADANHDTTGEAWLREMFAAFFEDETRITVDRSPSTYYAYEFGATSLFYHHGHKKGPKVVDGVFAGRFREIYGRTKFSYGHLGHRHADELLTTSLMKIEQHETLASPDAHEANGGYPIGRSAKVITYSKLFGEVGRNIVTPEMIMGAVSHHADL